MRFFEELKPECFQGRYRLRDHCMLLIQVTDILLASIGAPPRVMQTLFVVLSARFVIAVFFAWAFELTPEGVNRESEVDRSHSITIHTGQKLNYTIIAL